jgi:divalent metal cation (Fe/Co/Zn/Cd) transporter
MLLDEAIEEYPQIKEILEKYKKEWIIQDYHCLKTRLVWNNEKYVEYHMVLSPSTTIQKAHDIWDEIEHEISLLDKNTKWYVIYHPDPHDDSYQNGCY